MASPGSPAASAARPSPWLILAVVLAGLAAIVVTQLTPRNPGLSASFAYRVGMLIPVLLLPALIGGVFAIRRRFRNARSQLIIVLIIWGLFIAGSLGRLPEIVNRSKARAADDRMFHELTAKANALRAQLADTIDPAEQERLTQELRRTMEASVGRLSSEGQPGMLVTMELMKPMMDESGSCLGLQIAFLNSPAADSATAQSADELATRISSLDEILAALRRQRHHYDAIPARARALAAAHPHAKEHLEGAMASFRRQMPDLRAVNDAQMELYSAFRSTLILQRDHWGKWSADEEDGAIIWESDELLEAFQALQAQINDAAQREEASRRRLLQAPVGF